MKSKYYHATSKENLTSILDEGIKPGYDGVVYLCKTPYDAAKFCVIRGVSNIVAIEFMLDDNSVTESFDHSEKFFQCKAYYCERTIEPDEFTGFIEYKQDKNGNWI